MHPRLELQQRLLARAQALWSLYAFVCGAWPLVVPAPLLVDHRGLDYDHIHTVCMHLQAAIEGRLGIGNGRRLLIAIPPGHGKSLLASVMLPAWLWALDPSWSLLFSSYGDLVVKRDARLTRQLIRSDWYQENFVRGAWSIRRDQNTLWLFANTAHGFRQGMTVGGENTGHRGHFLLIDDPSKVRDIHSPTARVGVIDWYGQTMSSRFIDPSKAVIICIMQRLHDEDLIGHLIRRGGFALLKLQSICEEPCRTAIWQDPRRPGELLFPARFSMPVLEEAKLDMTTSFAAQHQQEPVDLATALFPRSAWRFWKREGDPDRSSKRPVGCDTAPAVVLPRDLRVVLTADCGFRGFKHNDRVAIHRWGAAGPRRYLLDRRTQPLSFVDTCTAFEGMVRDTVRDHGSYEFALVEEKANGSALVDVMRDKVGRLNPSNYKALIHPQDDKRTRAAAWSPMLRAGDLFLPESADWLEEFVAEFERFPRALHDDDVDAASLALIGMREGGFSVDRWERVLG